jgi:RNA polymerase sigma-70 factor (ECF subfamily)
MALHDKHNEFETIALPYLDALYGFAVLLTGEKGEAEDLVQDAYLRAWQFFSQFQRGTNCKAWLFTIMKHVFLNQNQQRAREVLVPGSNGDAEPENFWDNVPRQVEGITGGRDQVFKHDIEKALSLLPSAYKLVVLLKDIEGFSYAEIAGLLDCPVGTVMSRLSRVRHLLRQSLHAYRIAG